MRSWFVYMFGLLLLVWSASLQATPPEPDSLLYHQRQQLRLARQLVLYEEMSENKKWVLFPGGTSLKKGDTSVFVAGLRHNLQLTADLPVTDTSATDSLFDAQLEKALKKFQLRHGLQPDGEVGQQTLEALNVSPAQRAQQIKVNLKRWLSDTVATGRRTVFVNVPDYMLQLLDKTGKAIWETRVVVGQTGEAYQTVVPMCDSITYLVINPSWNIPKSIIRNEIIPLMRKDRGYLARNHMRVYRQQGRERIRIPVSAINWRTADPETDDFMIVQYSGSWNAMGKVKFMFPNEHAIYLHDTPSKSLFRHWRRAYSHGCVRVEHPKELASYLLSTNREKAQDVDHLFNATTQDKIVLLPKPVIIKLRYYTSWVDDAGVLQFRKDIYNLDPVF